MTFGQQRTCALILCLPVSIYSESTFRFNTKMVTSSGRCSISTTLRKKGDCEQTIEIGYVLSIAKSLGTVVQKLRSDLSEGGNIF